MTDGLGLATKVGLDRLLTGGILGGNVQELPHHAWGLVAKRMDECLVGHAADEGIDHVGIGNVQELIGLLGEALNVLLEGLVGPLLVFAEIPGVPRAGLGTLEVADEDRTKIIPTADAVGLELLEPSSG